MPAATHLATRHPREHVGPDQEDAAEQRRDRQRSTVSAADQGPRDVGYDEADEPDPAKARKDFCQAQVDISRNNTAGWAFWGELAAPFCSLSETDLYSLQ